MSGRSAAARHTIVHVDDGAQAPANVPSAGLNAVRLLRIAEPNERRAWVSIDGHEVAAAIDGPVDLRVLETAIARSERVIVAREGGDWVVLGTLRTAPTPGVDAGDFVVRAGRLRVIVDHAFEVVGGTASFVVRAGGHVETVAEEITSRASSVQRIIARMLRLN